MEGREGGTTFTACACSLLLLFHLHLLLLKQVTLSGPPRHLWKKGMKILFCCPLSRNIRQRDATAVTKPALRVVAVEQRSGADSGSSTNRMLLPPHAWRPSPVARQFMTPSMSPASRSISSLDVDWWSHTDVQCAILPGSTQWGILKPIQVRRE